MVAKFNTQEAFSRLMEPPVRQYVIDLKAVEDQSDRPTKRER